MGYNVLQRKELYFEISGINLRIFRSQQIGKSDL